MCPARYPHIAIVRRVSKIEPDPRSKPIEPHTSPNFTTLPSSPIPPNESRSVTPSSVKNTENSKKTQEPLASPRTEDPPKNISNESSPASTGQAATGNSSILPKVLLVGIVVGIIVGLGGLGIGIYTLVQTTTTSTTPTTSASTTRIATTSFQLRWNSLGSIVAGTGNSGSGSNQLNTPRRVTIDSTGALYIADVNNNRIQKWVVGQAAGTTVAGQTGGSGGTGLHQLNNPHAVVVDSNYSVYVADTSNHRVVFWTSGASSGHVVAGVTGSSGSAYHLLNNPRGLAMDHTSLILYIADTDNHRVMSYAYNANNGTLVAGGNGQGQSYNQLNFPYAVYFDSSTSSLLIANNGADDVLRWVIGASGWTLIAGSINNPGNTYLSFNSPADVFLDAMQNIYVCDRDNHRIQLFTNGQKNGTTIAGVTNTVGNSPNLLNTPHGVILDTKYNLYVSDTNNHRILMFEHY